MDRVRSLWDRFRRQRGRNQLVTGIVFVMLCCCGSLCGWAYTDAALRSAGVLPTDTPQPTATQTPTPTKTAVPTNTPLPTKTAVPTKTQTPTNTATAVPSATSTKTPAPTSTQTPTSTAAPLPTNTAAALPSGGVVIVGVNKRAEYVDLQNQSGADVDLAGWVLVSEKGPQSCALSGVIGAGQSLRVWAMSEDAGQGGFNCGFGSDIWNNSDRDPAVLYDNSGTEVSRW